MFILLYHYIIKLLYYYITMYRYTLYLQYTIMCVYIYISISPRYIQSLSFFSGYQDAALIFQPSQLVLRGADDGCPGWRGMNSLGKCQEMEVSLGKTLENNGKMWENHGKILI